MTSLVRPVTIGRMSAPHRIAMAPMTRKRADERGVATNLMQRYYVQRADAALIITEGTMIDPRCQCVRVPGLIDDAQVEGWRTVTDAVHEAGGRIVVQLWEPGRLSHHPHGLPVAAMDATPDLLGVVRIAEIVELYRAAAARATAAGFDAVEIHAANGSLIDEFLRTSANHRADAYGGGVANRVRFLLEVVDAVIGEIGADRTGVQVAPHIAARALGCPQIVETILHLAAELGARRLAYLHLAEADWTDAPEIGQTFRERLRERFPGTILAAGEYTLSKALRMVGDDLVDVVAFGRAFIANPDLPTRLIAGLPLAEPDLTSVYSGDAEGYTTYPRFAAADQGHR
ncbi:MAG: alkene reductase [Micrococcales bacterium]|nr:alkene reductase [Micrococcales bacterium]